jgi:hypothetical protein
VLRQGRLHDFTNSRKKSADLLVLCLAKPFSKFFLAKCMALNHSGLQSRDGIFKLLLSQ